MDTTFQFMVEILNSQKAISNFEALISSQWDNNPFYSYEYLLQKEDTDYDILIFEMWSDKTCVALLPMIRRSFSNFNKGTGEYYDVISPYGYSGPLFREGLDEEMSKMFWDYVDKWYKANNVVSEFVRFSLNGNEKGYSGTLVASLENVVGTIHSDQELQWKKFLPKVRNNYRKAEKNYLSFKVFSSKEISKDLIYQFYEIYTETMDRNNASKNYYFSINFFESFILKRPEKFALAFSYYEEQLVSAELLIIHLDKLYAYLGGTRKDFFHLRPNDFLRVEILRWAASVGLKKYILGGGRTNKDGLYKHKKSLFPKEEDRMFYTGRKIILNDVYNRLLEDKLRINSIQVNVENDFFPKYRNPNLNKSVNYSIITDKSGWNSVISLFSDSDVYHGFDYTQCNLKDNENAILFLYEDTKSKIALSLIIRKIEDTDYFDAITVYGYGGPLSMGELSEQCIKEFQKQLSNYLKKSNIVTVFGRLHPFISNQYKLLANLGILKNKGDVVYLDLRQSEEQIIAGYQKRHRTQINKYKKECTVFISNTEPSIDDFISIYNENMERVGASSDYYFGRDYYIKLLHSDDIKADFLFVRENATNKVIGAGILFKNNPYTQYHLSGAREEGLHLSPAKLLIDEMWRVSKKEGYKYFNLGGGLGAQQDSLFRFKSLFSNHYKPFYVWKYIVDEDAYNDLVNKNSKVESTDFFPLYRG
ncbi:GNAT family N-acetyltransferase [Robiginitalea sp. IMCC44478]|uniref:GNAT family N-acetyltransferase n=1 Tax=Robiginitalea sp. IMCC44478 TaxID=3459122 RepID=UPI0040421244